MWLRQRTRAVIVRRIFVAIATLLLLVVEINIRLGFLCNYLLEPDKETSAEINK